VSDLGPPIKASEFNRPTVQEALAHVMADLPNIGKGDKSPEGYAYRGIEAVTKHVQPLFAKYGVVITPAARITSVTPSPAMKDGWQDVFMEVQWTITGPDGSKLAAQTTGIGRDRSDKGANKAQTQAYKYLLLHLLCIADGKDDSDNQTYEHDRQEVEDPEVVKERAKDVVRRLAGGNEDRAKAAWIAISTSTPWTEADLTAAYEKWLHADPAEETTT
jgi:hypothetical protein